MAAYSLTFDRNYGVDRRSGWSVVFDGCVIVQFVSLPRATWVTVKLLFGWRPW